MDPRVRRPTRRNRDDPPPACPPRRPRFTWNTAVRAVVGGCRAEPRHGHPCFTWNGPPVSPRRKLQAVPLETPPAPEATALDKVAAWVGQADLSQLKCRARTHVWSEAGGIVKETPAGWWEKDPCVNGCGCHRVTVTDYDGYQVGRPHILYDPDYLL